MKFWKRFTSNKHFIWNLHMTEILFLIKSKNHFSYFLYHNTMWCYLMWDIYVAICVWWLLYPIGRLLVIRSSWFLLSVHKVQVNYLDESNQHPKHFEPDLLRTWNVGHNYQFVHFRLSTDRCSHQVVQSLKNSSVIRKIENPFQIMQNWILAKINP